MTTLTTGPQSSGTPADWVTRLPYIGMLTEPWFGHGPGLPRRHAWTPARLIGAGVMTILGMLVTGDAWLDIYAIALGDVESSHILLVPIVFAWLIYARRGRFRYCRPIGTWVGPVMVAIGWGVSTFGYHNAIQSFWHGGAILVTLGCFVTVVGAEVVWRFLPGFAVLIFLIPVPGMIRLRFTLPLQTGVASVTAGVLEVFNVPVDQSGNLLVVNDVPVNIAEACNGMRMVFALVLVSYAFAFSTPLRTVVRVMILVASPLSAMLCNIVRLVPTAWIHGYYPKLYRESFLTQIVPFEWIRDVYEHDPTVGDVFHDVAGWGMILVAFLLLMGIVRALRWALVPVERYNLAYN